MTVRIEARKMRPAAAWLLAVAAVLAAGPVAAAEGPDHGHAEAVPAGQAEPGETVAVPVTRSLFGEVSLRPGRVAEITPRVSGTVTRVERQVGDRVEAGDTLAVLASETLAEAKTDFLAARSRLDLARQTLARKERLAEQQVASEAELLEARHGVRKARAEARSARRRLDALGVDSEAVAASGDAGSQALARYEVTAPRDGTLLEQRLRPGQWQGRDSGPAPLVVADTEAVWAELQVYPRYRGEIAAGQRVRLRAGDPAVEQAGEIAHVMPRLDAATRTATARVPLANPDGQWPPGQFVTAEVAVAEAEAPVVVPRTAVQTVEGAPVVFVAHDDGLEPRRVALGRQGHGDVAVTAGLRPGERYAATHTFPLKAELERGQLEGAGHH